MGLRVFRLGEQELAQFVDKCQQLLHAHYRTGQAPHHAAVRDEFPQLLERQIRARVEPPTHQADVILEVIGEVDRPVVECLQTVEVTVGRQIGRRGGRVPEAAVELGPVNGILYLVTHLLDLGLDVIKPVADVRQLLELEPHRYVELVQHAVGHCVLL